MTFTILFADDQSGIRQFCRQELEAEGFHVVAAEDGLEAIEALDDCPADLAVLDEHMPRCNGLFAARYIKHLHPHIPVILFTADLDFENCRDPAVDATVIKSEDLGELKAAIAGLLHDRPAGGASAGSSAPAPDSLPECSERGNRTAGRVSDAMTVS